MGELGQGLEMWTDACGRRNGLSEGPLIPALALFLPAPSIFDMPSASHLVMTLRMALWACSLPLIPHQPHLCGQGTTLEPLTSTQSPCPL